MPIYEYECDKCGHRLEALQGLSEAPLSECPKCSEAALRRLISAAGFRLKGGGWYETDFKKGNQRNVAQSDGKSEGKGDGDGGSSASSSEGSASGSSACCGGGCGTGTD